MQPNAPEPPGVPLVGHIVMSEMAIVAGCRRLGVPRPRTLPNAGPGEQAVDADDPGGVEATETPWVRDLLVTLGSPAVAVFAHRQEAGSVAEIAVFAVSSPWAAEQIAEPGSVYSLSLFSANDVLDRVAAFCRLFDRTQPDAEACELSGGGFLRAMEQAAAEPNRVLGVLRADGLGRRAAQALLEAFAACERRAQVTVVRRSESGRIDGSTAAWLDGGASGLWRVGAPSLATSGDYGDYGEGLVDRSTVVLSPTNRASLLDEISQGFPDGR